MAAESSSSVYVPVRSISLPTRLIHPKAERVEEELKKIQALNSSSSASSRFQLGLACLIELYEFVNEHIISSLQGQQALRLSCNTKLVQAVLDESILLIDVSDFAKDLIGTFMDQIHALQSTLRRRRGDHSTVESEIQTFIKFQKKLKISAAKEFKSLAKRKSPVIKQSSDVDQHSSIVYNILKQSNASALSILQSLLQFLSSSDENCEVGCVKNSKVRFLYGRIIGKKIVKDIDVKAMLGRLALLNVKLEAIKDELSYLSRRLIQHRASLLNVVTQ